MPLMSFTSALNVKASQNKTIENGISDENMSGNLNLILT